MINLFNYDDDGANYQAQAVLAYLRSIDGLENSWDDDEGRYMAEPKVARWENGREQGYVVSLYNPHYNNQLNIAFFEHRNSDRIHAVAWLQNTLNRFGEIIAPTITTADFGDVYKDKYDTSHSVDCGEASEMAEWIIQYMEDFWETGE